MPKQYEVVVTVAPRLRFGTFPIDMLRYDGLCPNNEVDSGKIERTLIEQIRSDESTGPIELRCWADARWRPTDGRWESFNWKVVEVRRTGRML